MICFFNIVVFDVLLKIDCMVFKIIRLFYSIKRMWGDKRKDRDWKVSFGVCLVRER